ncbi:hypothetical protein M758_6G069700 [Ceratodon purpureus]|nr:hypothetical protein M758_6G069700 [Ceratodon purpureus]
MASSLLTQRGLSHLSCSRISLSKPRKAIGPCGVSLTGLRRHGSQTLNVSSFELMRFQRGEELRWARQEGGRGVVLCRVKVDTQKEGDGGEVPEMDDPVRSVKQVALWVMAAVYTSYLFLLPYAPGDPVWAISQATITGVLNLSFNFFYVLPLANILGFHLLEAAVVHPADEALFNFVLGWALLFAPLIFTDRKRDRFPWSLDVFWLASMFLTNTFLIPYMAIRLNKSPDSPRNSLLQPASGLQRAFTNGARVVAVTGAAVGLLSIVWFVIGRPTEGFGDLAERWSYWIDTVSKDRPTYAFIWDLCCYTVFQPWLIGDNLDNIRPESKELVAKLRFLPYVGLVAYCWGLDTTEDAKLQ